MKSRNQFGRSRNAVAVFLPLLLFILGCSSSDSSDSFVTWFGPPDVVVGGDFEQTRLIGHDGNQTILSVVVGGPGLVAVGAEQFGAAPSNAAIWTSEDGVAWVRVPHSEDVFGGGSRITSVTTGGPGLVAVGSTAPARGSVWYSTDGISWSRVLVPETQGHVKMSGVTAGGPGLVAVGSENLDHNVDAVVWTSVDGKSWSRVPDADNVLGGEGLQSMNSVTAGGPGLVAVGSAPIRNSLQNAVVWTSTDGLSWSRIPHDEAVFGGRAHQQMHSVINGGPGLIAVGSELNKDISDAAVWTSMDGISWSRVPQINIESPRDDVPEEEVRVWLQSMASVASGGAGLVAVGADRYEGSGKNRKPSYQDAAVWTSRDGTTWSRIYGSVLNADGSQSDNPHAAGRHIMHDVTVFGGKFLAVGWNSVGSDGDGAAWELTSTGD